MVGVMGVEVGLVATVRVPGVPQMPVVFIVGRPVDIEKVYLIIMPYFCWSTRIVCNGGFHV